MVDNRLLCYLYLAVLSQLYCFPAAFAVKMRSRFGSGKSESRYLLVDLVRWSIDKNSAYRHSLKILSAPQTLHLDYSVNFPKVISFTHLSLLLRYYIATYFSEVDSAIAYEFAQLTISYGNYLQSSCDEHHILRQTIYIQFPFRNLDDGIPCSSRYFATVRRDMSIFIFWSILHSASSDNGEFRSSAEINSTSFLLTTTAETAPDCCPPYPKVNSERRLTVPAAHMIYLPRMARLTVDT